MAPRLFQAAFGALAAAWLLAAAPAVAQASEQAVKAAFIPKFTRYVEFPPAMQPGTGQPYYLCIIGRDPFGQQIDRAAASETVDGHAVAVRRFADTSPAAVAGCHIAFVAGADDRATVAMLITLRRQPTLTITDARSGKARGMIHFALVEGRVRFNIDNMDAAQRGVGISSRLLALAVQVKQ